MLTWQVLDTMDVRLAFQLGDLLSMNRADVPAPHLTNEEDRQRDKTNSEFGITTHIRRPAFVYTERELARLVGVKAPHIAYLENGRRLASLGLLLRLANELNMRPGKLAHLALPILADFGVR